MRRPTTPALRATSSMAASTASTTSAASCACGSAFRSEMSAGRWVLSPALLAPAAICSPAFATQYLTVEQAQQVLFPEADRMVSANVSLTPELKRRIEQASGVRVRNETQAVWRAERGGTRAGWFIVDEVVGKHEFITYAVGIDPEGAVRGIEILDYRESYGGQIRDLGWRRQFTGKRTG